MEQLSKTVRESLFEEMAYDLTRRSVRAQFLSEWESPDSDPTFEKVYEVILPRDTRSKHEAYRYGDHRIHPTSLLIIA